MSSTKHAFSCLNDYDPNALPVDIARQLLLDAVAPVQGHEQLFVRQALGRVLAADVLSPVDVPAHTNSAMDGWAVRHADLAAEGETRLRLIGTALAGKPLAAKVSRGETARIMTGAVLPEGSDTVVVQEVVRAEGDDAVIPPGQRAGQHVRFAGEDVRAGGVAIPGGKLLRPAELGVIASLGVAEVCVCRRVRVAIFSTGDELCSIGTPLAPGSVYDSNRYTLWGMLTRLGCEVIDMGVVRDDPLALEQAFRAATACADVVITSGGVSVGESDFTKALMQRLGEVVFWKIAMKPGRPMAFGYLNDGAGASGQAAGSAPGTWLFGLPGNPVAVMVTFYQFVRPALLKLAGVSPLSLPATLPVRCAAPMKKGKGRTEFQRGTLFEQDGEWWVRPTGMQGSGILTSMVTGDCFIVLTPEQTSVAAGDIVTIQLFDGLV